MHTIWLIRSHEYSAEKFWEVLELLKSFQGPLQFRTQEKHLEIPHDQLEEVPFETIDLDSQKLEPMTVYEKISNSMIRQYFDEPKSYHKVSWNTIFDQCQEYRIKEHISENDFIVLLTEHSNQYGWFTAGDPKGQRNLFVHTAFWEHYTGSDHRYPVAYHVASAVLKRLTFSDYSDLNAFLHKEARGCMNDFCAEKKKVSLKLRTADICPACMDLMDTRNVDRAVIRQVLSIIEGIRDQMLFKSRWKLDPKPLKLQIKGESKRIIFPDLGNLEVKFTPLEKTLFLFYLDYPEGIKLVFLNDFKPELKKIYASLYNGSDPIFVEKNIESLSSPFSNSASEKLSRIKAKLIRALGADLAQFYYPKGENAEPRTIEVEREWVEYCG